MPDTVLVVGESLIDIVRGGDGSTTEFPGGSAANVAVALARLDRAVSFATSWGDDARGRVLADWLARDRVELATDPFAVASTSTAQATLGSDGHASYEFDLTWRLNPLPDVRRRWWCTPAPWVPCWSRAPPTWWRCWSGCGRPRRSATTSTPGPRSPAPAPSWWPRSSAVAGAQ